MLQSYLTVSGEGIYEIVIEKSRFICHLNRVNSEEEAQHFIQKIKKQHWNATHNCSAYLIGENDQIQKANDDGEPSGTAGIPMLEVLKKRKLKDTCAVVTRYFGGIKLGAGGLIRAYGKSVSEGLNHVGITERKLMRVMHTKVNYTWIGKLENELRTSPYKLKNIHYADEVEFEIYVKESEKQSFTQWITELTNGKSENKEGIQIYLEEAFNN
ncbi:YigZ family protein [Bacillus sp. CLL-7-23]|uniref:YigZ family protein n=1 Tax=Bacillus changyiensis TaxID=3004103 RepID=A0ABT4WZY9_9BACI|nr:YigZ family protein [Bacillus changyiensis]MDA7025508.1 YigZ family protein [Bacillus changyiensis]